VTTINELGIYVLIQGKEYFIPFREYPTLMNATITDLMNIVFLPPFQLRWNELDVDIELQALEQPENFPLIFK
jgi:hypothetical protein